MAEEAVGAEEDTDGVRMQRHIGRRGREGQAIVELVVALVCLLVLVGGIVVLGRLGRAQTRAMMESRRAAGLAAMSDAAPFSGPEYVGGRTTGGDGATYSRDDGTTLADAAIFQGHVVRYGRPVELAAQVPGNEVSTLYGSTFPQFMFGFTHGEHRETVTNLPIVRNAVYRDDRIEVRGEAWLTWTKGIY